MGKTTCSAGECTDPAWARGWCDKHYRRWLKHGDPLMVLPGSRRTAGERFWAKVDKSGRCWMWSAARTPLGYGKFGSGGVRGWVFAHRFAYELLVGPIPDGLHLDHLCRNPPCPAGHAYDEVNTRIVTGGYRQCRACDRERTRVKRGYQGNPPNAAKTHCINGHEFSPENTCIGSAGERVCRACVREYMRRYRAGVRWRP